MSAESIPSRERLEPLFGQEYTERVQNMRAGREALRDAILREFERRGVRHG